MKYVSTYVAFCFLALLASTQPTAAAPVRANQVAAPTKSPFMRIFGPSLPPYGYVVFCENNPRECRNRSGALKRIQLTTQRLLELDDVNRMVNETIEPVTDREAYGISEYWTVPDKRGDCEDYALLKRRILESRGWPQSALLITVVRDERGDGHAVLTVRTAQGDYILDNKTSEILAWSQTPYHYVMRQSYLNPQNWMRLSRRGSSNVQKSGSGR